MVGRNVMVPAETSPLNSYGMIEGMVELPSSTRQLTVSVLNGSGELVNRFELGEQAAGSVPFVWDGTNSAGEEMPFDDYTIKAEASIGGESTQLTTLLASSVNSVSISQTGSITLNLSGMGSVPLEDVREIN
jgi:flagellar basal-body rod modification protein FlgD